MNAFGKDLLKRFPLDWILRAFFVFQTEGVEGARTVLQSFAGEPITEADFDA